MRPVDGLGRMPNLSTPICLCPILPAGNYNFVCRDADEMAHGLMLSLASLAAVWRYPRGGLVWLAISGVILGAAVLTKVEVAAPGLVASTLALVLTLTSPPVT